MHLFLRISDTLPPQGRNRNFVVPEKFDFFLEKLKNMSNADVA